MAVGRPNARCVALAVSAIAVGSLGCSTRNPAFDAMAEAGHSGAMDSADDDDAGDGHDDAAGTDDGAGEDGPGGGDGGDDPTAPADEGDDEGNESGGVAVGCGNGQLDPGEDCDFGQGDNEEGCTAACERTGDLVWDTVLEQPAPSLARYRGVAVRDDRVYAVGAADIGGSAEPDAVIGAYAHDTGDEILVAAVDDTVDEGEAFAIVIDGDEVFVGGTGVDEGDRSASLVRLDADTLERHWRREIPDGTTCRAITIAGGDIAAVYSVQLNVGYGRAEVEMETGWVETQWTEPETPGSFEGVVAFEPEWFAVGTEDGQAIVQEISDHHASAKSEIFAGGGDDPEGTNRFQAVLEFDDDVIAAGFQSNAASKRDPWVVRVDPEEGTIWTWTNAVDASQIDEIEAVAALSDDRIVAVGFSHAPRVPKVWVLDADDGALLTTRTYPELADGVEAAFRGVAVGQDDAVYVVGVQEHPGDAHALGIVARLSL